MLTRVSVVIGYALLGACWLIVKTEGETERDAYALAKRLVPLTIVAIVAVSATTPFLANSYVKR